MNVIKGVCFLAFLAMSCNSNVNHMESPLAIVVKLKSAEAGASLEEAKKYIDVEKVYSKNRPDSITAEEAWKTYVMFGREIAKDKKFTNAFKYHNYNIREKVNGNESKVFFESIDLGADIRKIVYSLEERNNQWIVISIDYEKR